MFEKLKTKLKVENTLYGHEPFFTRIKKWWVRRKSSKKNYPKPEHINQVLAQLKDQLDRGTVRGLITAQSGFVPNETKVTDPFKEQHAILANSRNMIVARHYTETGKEIPREEPLPIALVVPVKHK